VNYTGPKCGRVFRRRRLCVGRVSKCSIKRCLSEV